MDNEIGGLSSRAEHTSTLASLVAGTCVLLYIPHVVLLGLEPNHWHPVVELSLNHVLNQLSHLQVSSRRLFHHLC